MARVVMHVDLDAFYASVEQLKHPELRGQPVIVGGLGLAGERGVVAAASYEARAFGVRSAMPLTRARRPCPQGNFVPADFAAYRQASRQVFRILTDYSPTIEPLSLDEAYLDLTGSEALLGPIAQVAAGLQARVRSECGLDISVGVATGKVVAKVASELRKPRGLVIVPAGQEAGFLAPLPVSRLAGCGPAAVARKRRGQPARAHPPQARLPVASDRDDAVLDAFVKLVREHLEPGRPVRLIGAGVANPEAPAIQLDLLEARSGPRSGLDAQLD